MCLFKSLLLQLVHAWALGFSLCLAGYFFWEVATNGSSFAPHMTAVWHGADYLVLGSWIVCVCISTTIGFLKEMRESWSDR